jgi:hypothetical protein
MLNYIYYRAYCFYKKNGLAIEPHTWATVVPTFIIAFLLYIIYYIGVVQKVFPKVQGTVFFYAATFLGLNFVMDRVYEDKYNSYKSKWDKEQGSRRFIKGIMIAVLAIGGFIGLFIIVNELRKIKS